MPESAPRFISLLTKNTYAMVLAGGRGSRLYAPDGLARQARGALRRQVPHHRLRAVQLREFGHPPHRCFDPVQGAQPDPAPPARLVVP